MSDNEDREEELSELSLDDLGAAYARAAAEHDPEAFAPADSDDEPPGEGKQNADSAAEDSATDGQLFDSEVVTPEAIIEAALFVGHPDNDPFSEQRLASLIRDFTPEEVVEAIERLNQSYREADQGIRIVRDERGYRMTVAPEVESVRRSFLGKVREARLTQSAIEVLSLVAYQPGIDVQSVQDQRGRESGALLNQLVRRQLLQIERVKPETGGRAVAHYYPTERFLVLFGINSLEDLPQVEEGLREG
jgi:segregation and condensation protein B